MTGIWFLIFTRSDHKFLECPRAFGYTDFAFTNKQIKESYFEECPYYLCVPPVMSFLLRIICSIFWMRFWASS